MKKELKSIAEVFTKKAIDKSGGFLMVEYNGVAVNISHDKYRGYQVTQEIKPNITTGSGVTIEGDERYETASEVFDIIKSNAGSIPNFYRPSELETIKFLTLEQAINLHNNILSYKIIK